MNDQLLVVSKFSAPNFGALGDSFDQKECHADIEVEKALPVLHYVIGVDKLDSECRPKIPFKAIKSEDEIPNLQNAICLYHNEYTEQNEKIDYQLVVAIETAVGIVLDRVWHRSGHQYYQPGTPEAIAFANDSSQKVNKAYDMLRNQKAQIRILWTKPEARTTPFDKWLLEGLEKARNNSWNQYKSGELTLEEIHMVWEKLGIGNDPAVYNHYLLKSALAVVGLFAFGAAAHAINKIAQQTDVSDILLRR